MEFVQPIREKNKIEEIKSILKIKSYRDYLLFVMGINTGLRISDLLKLKVLDVKEKSHITIREEKTNKEKRFILNSNLKEQLEPYITLLKDEDYLFQSRQGEHKPLDRSQAYRIINNAAKKAGIQDKIGTHTLRKTFGYHHYKLHKDVAVLQDILNHSAPSVTLRYIGINEDIKDKSLENFCL